MNDKKEVGEWKECQVCGCPVKSENYDGHMQRVHRVGRGEKLESGAEKSVVPEPSKRPKIIGLIVIVAAVGLAVYYVSSPGGSTGGQGPNQAQLPPTTTQAEIQIPLAQIGTDASLYTYNDNGIPIYYFAAKGSDNQYHVAMDACDVCYPQKKGYRQVGDVMKCNNCGREFAINGIGTQNQTGGCWPSYLQMSVGGENISIQIADLGNKRYMFE